MADRAPSSTTSALPAPALSHWLRQAAVHCGSDLAIVDDSRSLTYAQLLSVVDAERERIVAAGAVPSDRIAIAATRSVETIVAILACVDAGIGYVPLDLSYPAERLAAMLATSRPRLVLGDTEALSQLRHSVAEFPTLDRPAPAQAVHAAEQDLAYVLFTSGSTGMPKGVAMGAAPLRHLIAWHAAHSRLGQAARTLQFAPLSFDVHFQEILSTIACGGTLVLLSDAQRRDPAQLHAAIVRHGVQRLFLPYVALQMLAEASRANPPTSLREVVSAGEQLQVTPAIRALFSALPQAELHNHYGPTESHVVTAHELKGDAANWPEIPPIGVALPHVRLSLVNSEVGGDDETGELLLGGDTLAHGYIGREDLTAERFLPDPQRPGQRWYVTGDLVRRDANGSLTYLGRADDQVKVDGFRIEPGEIELALMRHPAVRDAVVTAPLVPGAGRQLVAHLVLRETTANLPAVMRSHLRGKVPDYMVPVRYVVLDKLPTTPSGKINRRGLPLPEPEAPTAVSADPGEAAGEVWSQLLGMSKIAPDQNLFDLGARSLLVLRFVARMRELGFDKLSVTDVYDRPTLRGIGALMRGEGKRSERARLGKKSATSGIAIVGMAARAGDAKDVDELWEQLLGGKESLRRFRPEEVDPAVPAELRQRENFVAARGVLENAERFDAGFFGISAREAVLIDPQQRLLLELCWTALEQAGIDPSRRDGRVGVYAGTANNSYITSLRDEQPELIQQAGEFAAMLASEKDYVATRIAHRLDLDGPALSIHTACSTGLVAVAQAWHALASGQCEVALAGGATVVVPQHGGYLHVEGGMESADGRCRPFDADASGTVFGSGGAVVVLKRLEDALAAGDHIHAVIRGVGLNNDGADKASFTAPSVSGQAGAIMMAIDEAQVDPRSIGYVEAHGTGTALGDPIEVAALTRAWREYTQDNGFCRLGSIKGHLGHTVAAAGVLGLIKTALSLEHEIIPATLHFHAPNPQIDFAATPFVPVAGNTPWPRSGEKRRAAVSSFGVGGTNAHVVVEEAPVPQAEQALAPEDMPRAWLLPLSARSAEAALQRAQALAEHLDNHPDLPLQHVLATLVRGRQAMPHRLAIAARNSSQAAAMLRAAKSTTHAANRPRVVFLFPGQGSQHAGMVRGLYDDVPAFRAAIDDCLAELARHSDADFRGWLIDAQPGNAEVGELLAETRHAQPALFSVCYALAAWLDSLGIRADAMIGHSIGEYAAACRAGVFTLPDAISAVVARGLAMFEQPRGTMLAVRTDAASVEALLPPGVEIAGCNAPALTVVAGPADALRSFAVQLEAREIGTTALRVSHAFHSASMDGALPAIERAMRQVRLSAPDRTLYSCVSGAPLTADEARSPSYWARQVRSPVQFSRAVQAELDRGDSVFIEVGPGQALSALLRQYRTADGKVPRIVPLLGPANAPGEATLQALQGLGAAWSAGIEVHWPVPAGTPHATLPTYPFGGQNHWFKRKAAAAPARAADVANVMNSIEAVPTMSRIPNIERELAELMSGVSGLPAAELSADATFLDLGLDSLSLTQATLEIARVFGIKMRFRRLLEDLDSIGKLARQLDAELPAGKFAPTPAPVVAPAPLAQAAAPVATVTSTVPVSPMPLAIAPAVSLSTLPASAATGLQALMAQQLQLMSQQLSLLGGAAAAPNSAPAQSMAPVSEVTTAAPAPTAPAPAESEPFQPSAKALVEKPFGASARITLERKSDMTPSQSKWLGEFVARYNARTGKSKSFSQDNRKVMADPRVVTGFNPQWKDLVYPIVVDKSKGARLWDLDGNEYIDLLSCFGANLLGYQPDEIVDAMVAQLQAGIEVGPQHPLAADVALLISEFTGMERVAFCNTGSEAVMGAMRIARTVTGRKTIAIFSNSYHGIFDEVVVRGTKQLRSLSAAPGILANAVENILVLDWNSEDSLRVLRERGHELAAIMTEPIQNKYPTLQPREFVKSLRQIADGAGCALIFDEVVTGFRVAPGGAQEFYGVRADIATYGKIIGGGLPFAAIGGSSKWLDALDGGHWQYGDDSYPEAGVTYFAGTFVRHPLALAAAHASLLHLKRGGRELYRSLNDRTQRFIERLNTAFVARGAPVKAVHCASLWRLSWDDDQKYISLFYYLVRYHGLHLYEQFGHFVTEAMGEPELDRIFTVFTNALDELMALGFITSNGGTPPPLGPGPGSKPDTPDTGPLSPGQTERWLVASYDDHARRALNESLCLSLAGEVNRQALEAAVNEVVSRHEAFRSRFDTTEPLQHLGPPRSVPIARLDLSKTADAERALDEFCTRASEKDFPLDRVPLAELTLIDLPAGGVVIHLVGSHLILDGWAASAFVDDLGKAYRARCTGVASQLPPAESPRRFAIAEQARWAGEDGESSRKYWRELLRNPPAPLALGDLTPPEVRTYVADTHRSDFDGPLLAALQHEARGHGATLFQLLLAAVTVLLARRSGQPEFVVCIPFASQSLADYGSLMSDGVLDLPLRLRAGTGDSGTQVLRRVRSQLMDALDHPLATQGTVARELGIPSRGNRPPFTGVFFNMNPRVNLADFAPLTAQMREGRKRGTLGEILFNFYDMGDRLTLDLHYSTEFFSPGRVAQIAAELRSVCEELAGSLDRPLSFEGTGKLVPARPEIDARVLKWNATKRDIPAPTRFEQWVARQARETPERLAVIAAGRSLSYGDLDAQANRIAHALIARGAKSGDLVGLCLGRTVELMPALLGILKSGAAYVPLDPSFPRERLIEMADDAKLALMVTESPHAALVPMSRDRQLLLDADAGVIASQPAAEPVHASPLRDDALIYVIYTSGSTGKPKGVMLHHRGVCNLLRSMLRCPGLTADDRMLALATLSFDMAVPEVMLPLVTGARTVLMPREDAADAAMLIGMIEEMGITVMQATPTTCYLLLDGGWRPPKGFKLWAGAEPMPPALAAKLLATGVDLWNLYGPTETTVWSTMGRISAVSERVSIGAPIDNTTVWILGDDGRVCPPGEVGEICIGGAGVAHGYLERPELNSERFVADLFAPDSTMYLTGDLGRWTETGMIEHMGRKDHQVKVRGYRIELGEIESRLGRIDGVGRCVVVTREDTPGSVKLVAYMVPGPGAVLEPRRLRDALKSQLPEYMVPSNFVSLDALPLLPNGKIDRKSLPEPTAADIGPVEIGEAARAGTESLVAKAMAQVLGLPAVGRTGHFFELGGHSLIAAKLAAQLSQELGIQIRLRTLFEAPTVERLAAALDAMRSNQEPQPSRAPVIHRSNQAEAPLTAMQERIRFVEELHPGRVAYNSPSGHRLSGPLDLAAFQRAFNEMVSRQPSLRTTIQPRDGGYVQRVHEPNRDHALSVVDLSSDAPEYREKRLHDMLAAMTGETFDLNRGPLFKATLFKLADDDHALFFMAHHIVWDGWSFDVLYAEFSALYEAYSIGRQPVLAPLAVTYGDYAQWHQDWLKSAELREQVEHWKKHFSPEIPLTLPLGDYPRTVGVEHLGGTVRMDIDQVQLERLRNLAKLAGTTTSIVILAVYGAFVSQWLDEPMPAIGIPVRGRGTPELDAVMGFFNNMLPVRLRVDKSASVSEWIRSVHQTMVTAYASQEAPFEILAAELEATQGATAPVLYQAMFSYQDARARQTRWGNLSHERIPLPHRGTTEDLNLWMVELESGIEAGLQFNSELFADETVKRLADRCLELLESALTTPFQTVGELLQPSSGAQMELARWEKATHRPIPGKDFLDSIAGLAASSGQEPAVEATGVTISRREFADRIQKWGDRLAQAGAPINGEGVALFDDVIEQAAASFAMLRHGLRVSAPIAAGFLDVVGLAAVVTDRASPTAPPANLKWVSAEKQVAAAVNIVPGSGRTASIGRAELGEIVESMWAQLKPLPGEKALCFEDDEPALRLFTLSTSLAAGACVTVAPAGLAADSGQLAARLVDDRVAWMHASGAAWRSALAGTAGKPLDLVAMIDVTELNADLADQILARGWTLLSVYRPALLELPVAMGTLHAARDCMKFGIPLVSHAMRILDDSQAAVPPLVGGQIWLTLDGRSHCTHSRARWSTDGTLQYLGEADGIAYVGGRRIDLNALCESILALQGVRAAAVGVRDDAVLHRCLVVGIEPDAAGFADESHWNATISRMLAGIASIRVVVGSLPRTSDGRIDMVALLAKRRANPSGTPAMTPTQQVLAEVWQSVLGVADIGLNDNFFELGGTSLTAMQVSQRLEERLGGRRVSPRRYVFDSLAQLAAAFDEAGAESTAAAVPSSAPQAAPAEERVGMLSRLRRMVSRT